MVIITYGYLNQFILKYHCHHFYIAFLLGYNVILLYISCYLDM